MNPWKQISLSDYENHMKLESVKQLQTLNIAMKNQFNAHNIESVVVLGVAGGNGLEHIENSEIKKLYGVDINAYYLEQVKNRYKHLNDRLECLCIDVIEKPNLLPNADLVIANLFIEYIGYDAFLAALKIIEPKYVSCIIQVNTSDTWVSDSPYTHSFDVLDEIHHIIMEKELISKMETVKYVLDKISEYPLPNGKKFIRLDFV